MEPEVSFGELSAFVAEFLSVDRQSLRPSTTIEQLGIDGDDADEFMRAFSKRFAVDLSDFRFLDYFGNESSMLVPFIWIGALFGSKGKRSRKPLRLSDLHRSASSRRWEAS
jgi:hypothetical protein